MNRLLVAGDTHGDPTHVLYLYEQAVRQDCFGVFVVGDYGYWEHLSGGGDFLDVCSNLATENDMPLYWIDGNHENHTMLRAIYGPDGERHNPTPEGFWEIRPGVYYVPRGTRWNWHGTEFMGLGGAYSVDKAPRIEEERKVKRDLARYRANGWSLEGRRRELDRALTHWNHFSWWPEEELTDEDVAYALRDQRPIDILLTHDKPRASNPDWNRKDLPECFPNQDRIQTVVRSLKPDLVIHGHLHHRYQDTIRTGNETESVVIGLDCNPDAAWNSTNHEDTFLVLDL